VLTPAECFYILEDKVIRLPPLSFRNGKVFLFSKERLKLKGGSGVANQNSANEFLPQLQKMLSSIQYGSITLIVQDGKVIQLEKNEKVRIK
jgi:hypothetical protein